MTIKIEHGKYYKTRSGKVVGPARFNEYEDETYPWVIPHPSIKDGTLYFYGYTDDGKSCIGEVDDDIVFEWTPEHEDVGSVYDKVDKIMHGMSDTGKRRAAFYLLGRFSLDLTERDVVALQEIKQECDEGES
jgi:hypothetical protein